MKMDICEKWENCILSLALKARENNGISEKDANDALESMAELRDKFKGSPNLPMRVVNVLIDMQAVLITSGDRHQNQLGNEKMAQRIYETAMRLSGIALDMTV